MNVEHAPHRNTEQRKHFREDDQATSRLTHDGLDLKGIHSSERLNVRVKLIQYALTRVNHVKACESCLILFRTRRFLARKRLKGVIPAGCSEKHVKGM